MIDGTPHPLEHCPSQPCCPWAYGSQSKQSLVGSPFNGTYCTTHNIPFAKAGMLSAASGASSSRNTPSSRQSRASNVPLKSRNRITLINRSRRKVSEEAALLSGREIVKLGGLDMIHSSLSTCRPALAPSRIGVNRIQAAARPHINEKAIPRVKTDIKVEFVRSPCSKTPSSSNQTTISRDAAFAQAFYRTFSTTKSDKVDLSSLSVREFIVTKHVLSVPRCQKAISDLDFSTAVSEDTPCVGGVEPGLPVDEKGDEGRRS